MNSIVLNNDDTKKLNLTIDKFFTTNKKVKSKTTLC